MTVETLICCCSWWEVVFYFICVIIWYHVFIIFIIICDCCSRLVFLTPLYWCLFVGPNENMFSSIINDMRWVGYFDKNTVERDKWRMNDDDNDDLKYNSSVARAQSHNGRNKIIYLNTTLLFFLKYKIDIQEVRTGGTVCWIIFSMERTQRLLQRTQRPSPQRILCSLWSYKI